MVTYHLFVGMNYYPSSGLGDYAGAFKEKDISFVVARGEGMLAGQYSSNDWFVIVAQDTDTDELVEVYRSGSGRLNEGSNLA